MATIRQRKAIDGGNWEVMVRRSGVPHLYLYFIDYDEAVAWVEKHEQEYIRNPGRYAHLFNREKQIEMMREREFKKGYNRKKKK